MTEPTQSPEPVSEGIWQVRVPMHIAHNPIALCYLIADTEGGIHLIDSGIGTPESREIVRSAIEAIGYPPSSLRTVTLSHFHGDHMGFVDEARATGALLGMHGRDAEIPAGTTRSASIDEIARWRPPDDVAADLMTIRVSPFPTVPVDVLLQDGQQLDIPGVRAEVVHTPGHTAGSVCVVLPRSRTIFTGDHLLPDQFPGVGLGAPSEINPLDDYEQSLDRIREFDGFTVLPGHGWAFNTLDQRVEETLDHHRKRTREVAHVLEREPQATVWQVASELTWGAGWLGLIGFYRLSALRQTEWHMGLVNSRR